MTAPLVWLFDVDGTLITTDGAAREAFSAALAERLGVHDDLASVPFAGRTDPLILSDILAAAGRTLDAASELEFWQAVWARMDGLLATGRGRVLPGVPGLLDAIALEPGWVPALLTGNRSEMARIKLGRLGIRERFEWGAFGEEAADRNALARVAVARAAERHGATPGQCVVVGDTEHDVACARAAGAWAVAVATGQRDRATLQAAAPDLLLDDLSDAAGLTAWAREIGARR
jgi:phosphoglycolate phosphatase-like HAD superfamily hydrolase